MKANELRIGNWFIPFIEDGAELGPRPIRAMEFLALSENPHWGNPIPLTEEWLLKFGFESNPYQDRYEKDPIHIECAIIEGETYLWIENIPHIKYVHQLQNLYFALTGEELTYGGDEQ